MNKISQLLTALIAFGMVQSATAQNVGIGTTTPVYNLDLHSTGNAQFNITEGVGGQTALFSRYTNRLEIQPSDAFQISIGGIDRRNLCIANNGYVGISTSTPSNHLQIGTTPGFSGNDLAIGNGTQGMSFFQAAGASTWYSNVNFALMPNGGAGNVGIGTSAPVNTLQIGSMGATGYGGNDIAFGNGTQASGITQTATAAQWYSTTDIVLMPRGNGHGRVGINTASPTYPLAVQDYVTAPSNGYAYFTNDGRGIYSNPVAPNISIAASADVVAEGFDAYSDARIKDIVGRSDASEDLETISKIQVTDYTLKDKVNHGNKPFKKVIAQQVETVYPQVVSTHVDFIPNVYHAASRITKTDKGFLLSFDSPHHISNGATKLKIFASDDHIMNTFDILSLPSEKEVLIDAPQLNGDKVFVYGEQVDDFRTVDYEGLTTLNISATQELLKIVKQQQAVIGKQNKKIATLSKKLEALTTTLKSHKPLN